MADPTHMSRRQREQAADPFPDIPYWARQKPCAGIFLPRRTAEEIEILEQLRAHIEGLWEGELPDGTSFLIAAFDRMIQPGDLRNYLPLHVMRAGVLSSFAQTQSDPLSTAIIDSILSFEIRWNGQDHLLSSAELTRLSLAPLWPETLITLHPGSLFERVDVDVSDQTGRAPTKGESETTAKVKVKTSKVPIAGSGEGIFKDTDSRLNEMSEQYKLRNIFKRMFRQNALGESGGGGNGIGGKGNGLGPGHSKAKKGPGFFESMAGWAKWHSPLGNKLAEQFGNRMKMVEKLINKGDIDSALKLALKMGKGNKDGLSKSRFPLRLPEMRSSLNFDFSGGGFSMPILGDATHFDLRQRYEKLAKELEEKGDFKRAAYIRSQLLENHLEAVETLERGELFDDAAKLSLDSGQPPEVTIRLYYKAGKKDIALALAKRTGCFDRLAQDSLHSDPEFHAFVIKAWTDMLLALDQPVRALEVTDALAKAQNNEPDMFLMNARHAWLKRALELEAGISADGKQMTFRPPLMVRTLLNARWDGSDLNTNLMADFPNVTHPGIGPFGMCFDYFQSIVRGGDVEALTSILMTLSTEADDQRVDQNGFWAGPAPQIADRLSRSYIAHLSDGLTASDMAAIKKFVRKAKLPVLAADLEKVRKLKKAGHPTAHVVRILDVQSINANPVERACILNNGSVLLHYKTGRLELRGPDNKIGWHGTVSDIKGMIPIGTGPSVMLLRPYGDGETRLTRFDTHRRKFTDIGILHLVFWHDVMTDNAWLVQIDNLVGALDLAALCAPKPDLQFLWSVECHADFKVVAFLHGSEPRWVTVNQTKVRFGVMQAWTYKTSGEIDVRYLATEPHIDRTPLPDKITINWTTANQGSWFSVESIENKHYYMFSHNNDYTGRQKARASAAERVQNGYRGQDQFLCMDLGRIHPQYNHQRQAMLFPQNQSGHQTLEVQFEGKPAVQVLARGSCPVLNQQKLMTDASHLIICVDNRGRAFRIDTRKGRVETL